MLKTWLVILLLSVPVLLFSGEKRALIIGIGNYPEDSGWKKINGDKDIPLIEDMLLKNGFKSQNIVELKNEKATRDAIEQEFKNLIYKSKEGDLVYIHFSGHGQQITDLDGDEESGFDEAWIPYDAKMTYKKGEYEGGKHIVDDLLNLWLRGLRMKVGTKGKIIVVADACHSGGGSRDEDDEEIVVRGASDVFALEGKKAEYNPSRANKIDWIFISACKGYQCNYEYNGYGSLSYTLSGLNKDLSALTCQQLEMRLRENIKNIVKYTQTPSVESLDNTQTLF